MLRASAGSTTPRPNPVRRSPSTVMPATLVASEASRDRSSAIWRGVPLWK
jgi:hypothetical protein